MTETTPKPRRWLIPVLILSVAANLLIVGIVIGALLSPDGPRRGDRDQRSLRGIVGEPFIRALPAKDRRALVGDALANRDRMRESRETLRQRFEAFLAALRADPFDAAEVARLLGEQRNAAIRRQELGEELLLKRIEAMSGDERAAYADALEERLRGIRR